MRPKKVPISGMAFAGVIEEVGKYVVTRFKRDDSVFAF